MNHILVTGSNGQLGKALNKLDTLNSSFKFFFTCKDRLDITNTLEVKIFCLHNKIDTIINCAAYTAVDKAEDAISEADLINHTAVQGLAQIAKEHNIKLIHISTDYVFDGKNYKPYNEEDLTNPQSIYGKSKLAGEEAIVEINPSNSIIIRTSWMFSEFGDNFVKTIFQKSQENKFLNVIFDQIGTPTYAYDLARTILHLIPYIKNTNVEVFHFSNEGVTSWYDIATIITKLAKISCTILPIESREYPSRILRPHYSLLNKNKIKKEYNLSIPYWQDSLSLCIKTLIMQKNLNH